MLQEDVWRWTLSRPGTPVVASRPNVEDLRVTAAYDPGFWNELREYRVDQAFVPVEPTFDTPSAPGDSPRPPR